jgi:hypothetical protein
MEPIYLELGPAYLTEFGKRWNDEQLIEITRHIDVIRDIAVLAEVEQLRWADVEDELRREGVPTAISSGVSQYGMQHLIDHLNGKTNFPMPTTVALALATTAPTSSTTGVSVVEANYTGYGRQTIAGTGFNAASAGTPSVATNVSTITFAPCTAGSSTLLGFILADSATTAAGNALWYGTLTSTVISTTQTPATVAGLALTLSMNGT